MLFNSIDFAIFLPIVFVLYWFVMKNHLRLQNALLILASYVFYGWWDWRFLSLILFSTLVDYFIGIYLNKTEDAFKRKCLLWISVAVNIGLLGFFKYYNFFVDNFTTAFTFFGADIQPNTINIILPVGISFYTFQTLSYTIDIYKRKLTPTKNFIQFAAFVSFFPQLVAGPIERASNLLPQFSIKRQFDFNKSIDGLRQILWGLFKKVVIADNCARHVNFIFANPEDFNGSTLLIGAVLFAFQIYCDFSGYSDIAIGISRLFGFNLKQNFAFPYFSRDIAEFWRRWHISLSTWFRDYLYIPLGGSRGTTWQKIRNVFIIFIISGFWHGANWTFIIWGLLNAIYFLPLLLTKKNRIHVNTVAENNYLPTFKTSVKITTTFILTTIAWVFFRSENVSSAISYLKILFSESLFETPKSGTLFISTLVAIIVFSLIEWIGRSDKYGIESFLVNRPVFFRWSFYYVLIVIIMLNLTEPETFIYFQF